MELAHSLWQGPAPKVLLISLLAAGAWWLLRDPAPAPTQTVHQAVIAPVEAKVPEPMREVEPPKPPAAAEVARAPVVARPALGGPSPAPRPRPRRATRRHASARPHTRDAGDHRHKGAHDGQPATNQAPETAPDVEERVAQILLAATAPLTVTEIRGLCRVRNSTLHAALVALAAAGRVQRSATGYAITAK